MMSRVWMMGVVLLAAASAYAKPREMSLQLREGQLRSAPSFLSRRVATATYGARLQVLEEKAPWVRVATSDGTEGWLHGSALTKKIVKLKAGEEDAEVAASSGELALAGKGFNAEVEAEFKTRNEDIDFGVVDRMEGYTVSAEEAAAFLKQGQLAPEGGTP